MINRQHIQLIIGKIIALSIVCLTATPCLAQTTEPYIQLYMLLPLFLQAGPFIDLFNEIMTLIQQPDLFSISSIIISICVGIMLTGLIIWIEYRSICKAIYKKNNRQLLKNVAVANVVSTGVSIPLSLCFQYTTGDWAVIGPLAVFPKTASVWTTLLLYIPLTFAVFLYIAYAIEKTFILRMAAPDDYEKISAIKKAVFFANIKGYAYPVFGFLGIIIVLSYIIG